MELLTVGQAAVLSVTEPPKVVYNLVKGLARMIADIRQSSHAPRRP